jgi:hypothetical protein
VVPVRHTKTVSEIIPENSPTKVVEELNGASVFQNTSATINTTSLETIDGSANEKSDIADEHRRLFLKVLGGTGLGLMAMSMLPKKASALVAGSAPTSGVVGVKDASNARINPATEESLAALIAGQGVTKYTVSLNATGIVITPSSGKSLRVYSTRFSLTADATSVSFRFTSGGIDYERYVSPKAGGLYGANNHPNFVQGGIDEAMYCVISGSTTVQINVDYLEV